MAKNWIAGAIKHPGALRATVQRTMGKGGFNEQGNITAGALSRLAKRAKKTGNSTLSKRVSLAKTLGSFNK